MTPAQREMLETLVTTTEATPGAAGSLAAAEAVRAALAEVDRLTEQRDDYAKRLSILPALDEATALATVASALAAVARPDTDYDYRREQAKRGMDALQSAKQHAARRNDENDALRAEVADLRSRAIPKAWVERAFPLEVSVTFIDGTGHSIALNGDGTVDRYDVDEIGDHHGDYQHSTLAAALDAAAKETT